MTRKELDRHLRRLFADDRTGQPARVYMSDALYNYVRTMRATQRRLQREAARARRKARS